MLTLTCRYSRDLAVAEIEKNKKIVASIDPFDCSDWQRTNREIAKRNIEDLQQVVAEMDLKEYLCHRAQDQYEEERKQSTKPMKGATKEIRFREAYVKFRSIQDDMLHGKNDCHKGALIAVDGFVFQL
jgi:ribosome recycling factor